MDSTKSSSKNIFLRALEKIIRIQASKQARKFKFIHKLKGKPTKDSKSQLLVAEDAENQQKLKERAAMEAFIWRLFASVSSVKAAYSEMQVAQFPYHAEAIQCADQAVVNELKVLSELKQRYVKKEVDSCPPHVTILLAEVQEQQSLSKCFQISVKKLESELRNRDSELVILAKQVEESNEANDDLTERLSSSESLCISNFVQVLHCAVKSVRSFVKLMMSEMKSAGWNLDAAAKAIEPDVVFTNPCHRCFVFEAFVSRVMLDGFDRPYFSLNQENQTSQIFYQSFKNLNSVNPVDFLKLNPQSKFAGFCAGKYLRLVHPDMESSFFGDLKQRKLLNSGDFPVTTFFAEFAEMAKRVWILQCLAFSLDEKATIFEVRRKRRFSEVFMESVSDDTEGAVDGDLRVAMTVVPGFKVASTVVQCQVYLSPAIF